MIPLGNITEESIQTIFDKTVRALVRQGERSVNDSVCRYRGDNNSACAAGFWMEDEAAAELEGKTVDGVINRHIDNPDYPYHPMSRVFIAAVRTDEAKRKLISDLQFAHDNSASDQDLSKFDFAKLEMGLEFVAWNNGCHFSRWQFRADVAHRMGREGREAAAAIYTY